MKNKLLYAVGIVILTVMAKYIGESESTASAVASVQHEAIQQHMPTGFNGVAWLTPTAELTTIRPNLIQGPGGILAEPSTFLGRPAEIDYYVKTGNVLMFIFHFADAASDIGFRKTDEALNLDYGPLSAPAWETDEYGKKYCSHRKSERFALDHCISVQDKAARESVVFYRTKP